MVNGEFGMSEIKSCPACREQQAKIDHLIYKAKLRESDHQALLVKYQATKKCWEDIGGKCEELKTQLNNMEACYIEKKKEVEALQKTNISLEAGLRKNSKNKQKLLGKNIELQKRIDEALEDLEYPAAPWDETITSVVKVLRGES